MNDAKAGPLDDVEEYVRSQPLLTLGVAGIAGALLGGLVMPRMGRFLFLAVAGYVGHELWQRQTRLSVDAIAGEPRRRSARTA